MKEYQTLSIEIVFIYEDAVRCSNTYSVGDDVHEDVFD